MSQLSSQVVSGGRGSNGGGGSGRKKPNVVRKGEMGRACDQCNRDHQPCHPTDPTNPRAQCRRCAHMHWECRFDRQVGRRGPAAGRNEHLNQLGILLSQGYTITLNSPPPATMNGPIQAPIQFPQILQQGAPTANNIPQGISSAAASSSSSPNINPSLSSYTFNPVIGLYASPVPVISVVPVVVAASPFHPLLPHAVVTPLLSFLGPPLSSQASPTPSHGLPNAFHDAPSPFSDMTMPAQTPAADLPQQLPAFPSINVFRNMAFEGDRDELFQHYFDQARAMSDEDRAAAVRVLTALLNVVQSAGGGITGSGGH
ncbi:hypothetical protein N431DRAFT_490374 [Stipitochalara longipes BDJ]|nr:hypothetical protein N431DRAFT_490374 [Stipitochalara longipes BDJ]